jgi:hypothetical protein
MLHKLCLLFGSLALAQLVSAPARAEAAMPNPNEEHTVVLLDVGSAMREQATATLSKWQVARWRANQFLSLLHKQRKVSVLTFSATETRVLTPFQSPGQAKTAISALAEPSQNDSSAPLAQALCLAVDELERATAGTTSGKRILVEHSGAPDTTLSPSECAGDTSAEAYGGFEPNTWQFKVRNKLRSGSTLETATAFLGVLDVDAYRTYAVSNPPASASEAFLIGASEESGGQALIVDANGSESVLPRAGDNNEDGCVDARDVEELSLWSSEEVDSAHPLVHRLDVNRDGRLDNQDANSSRLVTWGCAGP